jgi:ligand-binding sensor domain-containing protein/serine phosphatase RsbU (regulator of sigma subunit)
MEDLLLAPPIPAPRILTRATSANNWTSPRPPPHELAFLPRAVSDQGWVSTTKWAAGVLMCAASVLCAPPARALDPHRAIHQYVSRTWGVAEGLPQNSINATVQTPDGYLWLATEEGVVRFDGARFTIFSEATNDAITHNDVTDLCVDGGGALWVAVRGGGVLRYEHGAFRVWHAADGLVDDFAMRVACGPADDVWAGTSRGVTHFHHGKLTSYAAKDGMPSDNVTALVVDPEDAAWVGTDAGVVRLSPGAPPRVYGAAEGLRFDTVTQLKRLRDGTLLVAGRGAIARLGDDGTFTSFAGAAELPTHDVTSIVEDSDGNLWVGTREGGIHRRDNDGEWSTFGADQGLADDVVQSLMEDSEKSLWIGTETRGVQRLANSKIVTYGRFDGITGGLAWSIFEDRDGNIWVGTRGAGAQRRGPDGTVRTFATKDGMPADTVYGIAQAPDGAMWFATQGGGVARMDQDGKFTVWDTSHGLSDNWARSVFADSHGNVWIGMEGGGLDRLKDGKLTHYSTDDVLASNVVRMIREDRTGVVWFGTDGGGVTRFGDEKFTTLRKSDGLSDDSVIAVTLDDDGTYWFGTYHGVTRMQNGKLFPASTKDGLFTNIAFTVLNGSDDSLFMSSNMGITEIKKRDFDLLAKGLAPSIKGKLFGVSDGMKIAECNGGSPAGIRAHDGKLWFATMGGAVMIDPAALRPNPTPPPVVIESLKVNRLDVALHGGELRLEPGSRDFELTYTAMSFLEPERVRFRYRLVGFDQDWVEAGPRRAAFYTNLSPGSYTFRVIAANADGTWNETGAQAAFVLLPHFYETWPFYVIVGVGVVLLAGAVFRARVAQLRAYSRELERRVAARTRELGEALSSLEAKDKRISEDLEQARAFQQGILPKLPDRKDVRFGVCYAPADQVGGDVYDVCEIEKDIIRVFMADTTGHGVQASLRTMVLRTEYDAVKRTAESPGRALEQVNRRLFARHKDLELRCNAVCFDVRLNGLAGDGIGGVGGARVTYANCAQPPLLHASASGVDEVYEKGPFLAMTDEIALSEREIALAPGDRLLVFTDGVFEQEDQKGAQFGFEPLTKLLADGAVAPSELVDDACAKVRAFAGRTTLDDDVTIICVAVPKTS